MGCIMNTKTVLTLMDRVIPGISYYWQVVRSIWQCLRCLCSALFRFVLLSNTWKATCRGSNQLIGCHARPSPRPDPEPPRARPLCVERSSGRSLGRSIVSMSGHRYGHLHRLRRFSPRGCTSTVYARAIKNIDSTADGDVL